MSETIVNFINGFLEWIIAYSVIGLFLLTRWAVMRKEE